MEYIITPGRIVPCCTFRTRQGRHKKQNDLEWCVETIRIGRSKLFDVVGGYVVTVHNDPFRAVKQLVFVDQRRGHSTWNNQ